jgi:hypothetical protein
VKQCHPASAGGRSSRSSLSVCHRSLWCWRPPASLALHCRQGCRWGKARMRSKGGDEWQEEVALRRSAIHLLGWGWVLGHPHHLGALSSVCSCSILAVHAYPATPVAVVLAPAIHPAKSILLGWGWVLGRPHCLGALSSVCSCSVLAVCVYPATPVAVILAPMIHPAKSVLLGWGRVLGCPRRLDALLSICSCSIAPATHLRAEARMAGAGWVILIVWICLFCPLLSFGPRVGVDKVEMGGGGIRLGIKLDHDATHCWCALLMCT